VKTEFVSVSPGQNASESTAAAVLKTSYDAELTSTLDFIAHYNIQVGNQVSGGYTHHIILTLESEITGSLDLDTSFIWDRTGNPTESADGTRPQPDDYRLTLGISYTY
jgi:long-subunit fatty acid transport protein